MSCVLRSRGTVNFESKRDGLMRYEPENVMVLSGRVIKMVIGLLVDARTHVHRSVALSVRMKPIAAYRAIFYTLIYN